MPKHSFHIIYIVLLLFLVSSCRVSKFLSPEEKLLVENELKVESEERATKKVLFNTIPKKVDEFDKKEAKGVIEQQPNSKFFGTRMSMRLYLLSNPNKNNWINRTLRKQGEAPVVFDYTKAEISSKRIEQYLETKGIFHPTVSFAIDTINKRKVKVTYNVYAPIRYKIRDVNFTSSDSLIRNELELWKRYSSIIPEDYYDQNVLSKERDNLVTFFRNRGYYAFNRELITYLLDTTHVDHYLNVQVNIDSSPYADSASRDLSLEKFYINDLYVYIGNTADIFTKNDVDSSDIVIYRKATKKDNTYRFFYERNERIPLKPSIIDQSIFFDQSDMFRLRRLEQSYTGLSNLQNFRYVDISFTPVIFDSVSSLPKIDAHIRLLNAKRHSFSTALELNSSPSNNSENVGNVGLEWNLTYRNRNLFRGAEIFEIRNKLAVEFYNSIFKDNSKKFSEYFSTFESGMDFSLETPRFLATFAYTFFSRDFRPKTTLNAGYNYQARSQFDRFIINAGFGYRWRNGIQHMHQLLPIEFNIVRINIKSENFQIALDTLRDARLKYQYSDHFIMDLRYNYVYNGQLTPRQRNFTYFSMSAESAGNLLYLIDKIGNSKIHDYGNGVEMYHKFGVPYSQYVRASFDLRRYMALSSTSTFIARITGGIGIPYGNAVSLPYEKSFFAGGPNNIRAWRMRDLGPGSYQSNAGNTFDKVGDIMLVGNMEVRFPLFSIFEGALFVDAGNIWLYDEPDDLLKGTNEFPGGGFKFNKFYKDIAMGGGIGIRANIYITTIRFDFALPFRDPSRDMGEKWRFDKWKWSDIVVNFGIGYPF